MTASAQLKDSFIMANEAIVRTEPRVYKTTVTIAKMTAGVWPRLIDLDIEEGNGLPFARFAKKMDGDKIAQVRYIQLCTHRKDEPVQLIVQNV